MFIGLLHGTGSRLCRKTDWCDSQLDQTYIGWVKRSTLVDLVWQFWATHPWSRLWL